MDLPLLHSHETIAAPGGRFAWCAGRHQASWLHRSCPAGAGWAWHDHEHHEVFWLLAGTMRHDDDSGTRQLAAGDCVFVAAQHHHAATATGDGARWININLQCADCEALAHVQATDWPWHGRHPRVCRPDPARLQRLEDALSGLDPDSALDRDWLILSCTQLLDRRTDKQGEAPPAWFSDGLLQVLERVASARPADLSRITGRSVSQCNRIARRHYGSTCAGLLIDHRLARAAAALRGGDEAIATVAADHGFSNLNDFYRRFTRRYGMRPGPYRLASQQAH